MRISFLVIIGFIFFGCSEQKEEEKIEVGVQYSDLNQLVTGEMKLSENDFSVYFFVPEEGCEECSQQAMEFAEDYYDDERFLTIIVGKSADEEIPLTLIYSDDGTEKTSRYAISNFSEKLMDSIPTYYLVENKQVVKTVMLTPESINQELMMLEMELF